MPDFFEKPDELAKKILKKFLIEEGHEDFQKCYEALIEAMKSHAAGDTERSEDFVKGVIDILKNRKTRSSNFEGYDKKILKVIKKYIPKSKDGLENIPKPKDGVREGISKAASAAYRTIDDKITDIAVSSFKYLSGIERNRPQLRKGNKKFPGLGLINDSEIEFIPKEQQGNADAYPQHRDPNRESDTPATSAYILP